MHSLTLILISQNIGITFFRNYPPEAKVIFIIYLSFQRFNCANNIYKIFIKRFYIEHENLIDSKLSVFTSQIQALCWDKFKLIAYVLLFNSSSDKKILDGNEYGYMSIFTNLLNIQSSMLDDTDKDKRKDEIVDQQQQQHKLSYNKLRDRLLKDFKELLKDGVYLQVQGVGPCQICELNLVESISKGNENNMIIIHSIDNCSNKLCILTRTIISVNIIDLKDCCSSLELIWYCENDHTEQVINLQTEVLDDIEMLRQGLQLLMHDSSNSKCN